MTATESARPSGPTTDAESWVGIVDDDASIRVALARVLRSNGIRAETFGSAEEFLHRTRAGEPEFMVVDIHLGELSGMELRDQLESQGTSLPIIFITGHDDMLSECAKTAGACGYLRKPFEANALIALLRPHLRSSFSA